MVSDLRVIQRNNLTREGLQGMRLVVYYEMLRAVGGDILSADEVEIPVELAQTLKQLSVGMNHPQSWIIGQELGLNRESTITTLVLFACKDGNLI